jgi:hypothetical protein
VVLTSSLRGIFRIESRRIPIGLSTTGDGLGLAKAYLLIDKGRTLDTLFVEVHFANGTSVAGRHFTINLPATIKRTSRPALGVKETGSMVTDLGRWFYFDVAEATPSSCSVEFEGEILSTSARELDLEMWIQVSNRERELPVTLLMRGLSTSDVSHLMPAPQYRTMNAIRYDPLPRGTTTMVGVAAPEPIEVQVRDRARGMQTEFRVFLVGILVGVFSSFLASILWDLAREKEIAWSARKGPC